MRRAVRLSQEFLQWCAKNPPAAVQLKQDGDTRDPDWVQSVAAKGVQGSGGRLPYFDQIQASFGRHDVSAVQAFTGGQAGGAAKQIGAKAYATGNKVAFAGATDLHTAAHEAAHVVQQRGGVSLKGGVGQAGDRYEQHADAVADLVVQGKSAESLLDQYASSTGQNGAVQSKSVQRAEQMDQDGNVMSEETMGETRYNNMEEFVATLGMGTYYNYTVEIMKAVADPTRLSELTTKYWDHRRSLEAGPDGAKQVGLFHNEVDSLWVCLQTGFNVGVDQFTEVGPYRIESKEDAKANGWFALAGVYLEQADHLAAKAPNSENMFGRLTRLMGEIPNQTTKNMLNIVINNAAVDDDYLSIANSTLLKIVQVGNEDIDLAKDLMNTTPGVAISALSQIDFAHNNSKDDDTKFVQELSRLTDIIAHNITEIRSRIRPSVAVLQPGWGVPAEWIYSRFSNPDSILSAFGHVWG